jgi:glyoxylase I family protein
VDVKLAEMGGDAIVSQGPMAFDAFIPGWKTVWIRDPEGNIIEVSQGYRDEV